VYAYRVDEVRFLGYSLAKPETADYLTVTAQPMPAAELAEKQARSGLSLLCTLKPGLPLGPFDETIRLELQFGQAEPVVVELPAQGTIDSDISIVGPGWDSDHGRLSIGAVRRQAGATRNLFLLVRGEHRGGVEFKLSKVEPPWLQVTLGEPKELEGAAVAQIPLKIEIPPDSPQVNHLGNELGKYAEINLETTHPAVKQVRMYLKFAVEQ
jgi:hypothetical protein